jgi:hypothetical protein
MARPKDDSASLASSAPAAASSAASQDAGFVPVGPGGRGNVSEVTSTILAYSFGFAVFAIFLLLTSRGAAALRARADRLEETLKKPAA